MTAFKADCMKKFRPGSNVIWLMMILFSLSDTKGEGKNIRGIKNADGKPIG